MKYVAMILSAAFACAPSHAFDLKGLPLGVERSAAVAKFAGQDCKPTTDAYQSCAVSGETYAGLTPMIFDVSYVDGKFEGYFIRVQGRRVNELYEAIVARLGQPEPSEVPGMPVIKNKMPREAMWPWERQSYRWTLPDGGSVNLRFNGGAEQVLDSKEWHTTISVGSQAVSAALAKRRETTAKDAALKAKADM